MSSIRQTTRSMGKRKNGGRFKRLFWWLGRANRACREGDWFVENVVDVITTGNHVLDQKETVELIEKEDKLLRPENLIKPSPGKGFKIYNCKDKYKIGVLNLMGNIFMKKCDNVFDVSKEFLNKNKLKRDYDFLIVDMHGEITS